MKFDGSRGFLTLGLVDNLIHLLRVGKVFVMDLLISISHALKLSDRVVGVMNVHRIQIQSPSEPCGSSGVIVASC